MGWTEQEITKARQAMHDMDRYRSDPTGRASQRLVEEGREPAKEWNHGLGFVMNLILMEPGIVQRIRDEGFDARVNGTATDVDRDNPYYRDGERGWWREGWFAADDNLRGAE